MTFKNEKGRCFGELPNGDVITFEDEREMRAVESEYNAIQALFGKSPVSAPSVHKSASAPLCAQIKKRVRIRIDTDVEYIGNKKALA